MTLMRHPSPFIGLFTLRTPMGRLATSARAAGTPRA